MHPLLVPALLLSIADPAGRQTDDPADVVFGISIENGKPTPRRRSIRIRRSKAPFPRTKEKPPDDRATSKIHPLVEKWLAAREPSAVEEVLITFREDQKIPRFPEPYTEQSPDSRMNERIRARNKALIDELRAKRRAGYARMAKKLEPMGVRISEEFWLVRAVQAKMPLGSVRALVALDDVQYLEPVHTEDEPPQDDVVDGRAILNSDPYFNLGQTAGTIALLDTGIRQQHVQFQSPSHIGVRRDCVNGDPFCLGGTNTADDCWNHGTSAAGILTANNAQGNAYRGVTGITVDVYKVFPSSFSGPICVGSLNASAAVRGFQGALLQSNRVIVANFVSTGEPASAISAAADAAFDAGSVVVAAAGNFGPMPFTVLSPASAHKVLGVGAFSVVSRAQNQSQGRGPTSDGRTKPDIQAPTNAETASTGCPYRTHCDPSNTARQNFGGTSGATPFAGGAAALVRNFLRGGTGRIEPGYVYAYLINSGQQVFFDDTTGVGPVRLPSNGEVYIAKLLVANGLTLDLPFPMPGTPGPTSTLDAAIWWPETNGLPHNDVDLELIDPDGRVVVTSIRTKSVFERVRATMPKPGRWIVRIRGYSVLGTQWVYAAMSIETR